MNPRKRSTVFLALLLLIFLQLLTTFIESIYRLSLIKLSPGKELYGIALLLLPLLLPLIPERHEKRFLTGTFFTFIIARWGFPAFGALGQIILGGIGISAFLVMLCYGLSVRYRFLRENAGSATALAILFSMVLRVWCSTCDLSTEKTGMVFSLFALSIVFIWRETFDQPETPHDLPVGAFWENTVALFGLFAQFALLYWVFSSPAAPPAWTGCDYGLYSGLLAGSLVLFVLAESIGGNWSNKALLGLNILFVVLLTVGIRLHAPTLPLTPDAPAIFMFPAAWPTQIPLYLVACLAPVIMLGAGRTMESVCFARPRDAVFPVLLGMGLLIAMTMAFIFSYVWGYVGAIGLMMRNQFHLPFIAAGLLTLPVWLLFQSGKPRPRGLNLTLGGLALGLAVLSLTGIYLLTPRPAVTTSRDRTLTVVAFNMQQGSKIGGNHNYREQLNLLRRLGADIITLQENDTARPSGGNTDATRYFAEGLGYHAYYGPNGVSGTYGTAILSRFPLENPRTFFTYSDDDENATAVAEVVVNGRRIAIFSNHPSGSPPTRVAHARALVDEAAKYSLVIAAGDFNFEQTDPWYATVTGKLKDSWRSLYPDGIGKPHPWIRQPNAGETLDMRDRIDHIFVSPQIDVLESYYMPPPESETDHPIHWSVLKIK